MGTLIQTQSKAFAGLAADKGQSQISSADALEAVRALERTLALRTYIGAGILIAGVGLAAYVAHAKCQSTMCMLASSVGGALPYVAWRFLG